MADSSDTRHGRPRIHVPRCAFCDDVFVEHRACRARGFEHACERAETAVEPPVVDPESETNRICAYCHGSRICPGCEGFGVVPASVIPEQLAHPISSAPTRKKPTP